LSVRGARRDDADGIESVSAGGAVVDEAAAPGAPDACGDWAAPDGPAGGAFAGIGAPGGNVGVPPDPGGAADWLPGAAAVGAPGGNAGDECAGADGVCGVAGFDPAGVVPGGVLSGPRLHAVVTESDVIRSAAATAA
jgi:hypothetical protein